MIPITLRVENDGKSDGISAEGSRSHTGVSRNSSDVKLLLPFPVWHRKLFVGEGGVTQQKLIWMTLKGFVTLRHPLSLSGWINVINPIVVFHVPRKRTPYQISHNLGADCFSATTEKHFLFFQPRIVLPLFPSHLRPLF